MSAVEEAGCGPRLMADIVLAAATDCGALLRARQDRGRECGGRNGDEPTIPLRIGLEFGARYPREC